MFWIVKPMRLKCGENVVRVRETRNAYRIFVGKSLGKPLFGRWEG
jgi:hypothetical protein